MNVQHCLTSPLFYKKMPAKGSCPNAAYFSDHIISLPMHMRITYEEVQNVIEKVVYFVKK